MRRISAGSGVWAGETRGEQQAETINKQTASLPGLCQLLRFNVENRNKVCFLAVHFAK